MKLHKKIALVTGASRGIGEAIALKLARNGATVIVHYAHSKEKAMAVQQAIQDEGGEAELLQSDFSTMEGVNQLIRQVADLLAVRKLDILVNNAAIPHNPDYAKISENQFDQLVQVNLKAPFFITSRLLERMNDGGCIINISSKASKMPTHRAGVYGITKAALDNFTVQMASLLGNQKITVNSIAPGPIFTDMNREMLKNDEVRNRLANHAAMKGIGHPEDIAGAVAFLASPDASWVTGQWIEVSGGLGI